MPSLLEGVWLFALAAVAAGARPRARRAVLVADDDADVRAALTDALADEGWDVQEARNGREALERIEAGAYDVVLLDHRMPEMTGGDVCRELRARGRGVRVVMLTAAAAVRDLAAEVGADAWLGKPYGLDELFDVLERAAAKARGDRVVLDDLPAAVVASAPAGVNGDTRGRTSVSPVGEDAATYEALERRILETALERTGGNKSEAARSLGLARTTFLDKLRKFGLRE